MKERAMPIFGEDKEQTITLPNASVSANSNNLKQTEDTDEEEDDIVSKLSPLTDSQFAFCTAGKEFQKRLPLPRPYNGKMNAHIDKMKRRIEKKLQKYK